MLSASIFSGLSLSARSACAAGANAARGNATHAAAIPNCTKRAARRENAARAAHRRPDSGRRNGLFMQSHLNGLSAIRRNYRGYLDEVPRVSEAAIWPRTVPNSFITRVALL